MSPWALTGLCCLEHLCLPILVLRLVCLLQVSLGPLQLVGGILPTPQLPVLVHLEGLQWVGLSSDCPGEL